MITSSVAVTPACSDLVSLLLRLNLNGEGGAKGEMWFTHVRVTCWKPGPQHAELKGRPRSRRWRGHQGAQKGSM